MDSESALAKLTSEVDAWISEVMPTDYPKTPMPSKDDTKVIRETVLGYQVLQPHECLILDSPPMQRLRYIHQTALAYLVYPTATHTRFDHSLGCAKIAQDLGEILLPPGEKVRIAELRLAALLHDIGHSFFSHLSEVIMQSHFTDIYPSIKRSIPFRGHELGLAQIISYLIIKSERFYSFLDKIVHHYPDYTTLDLNNVAQIIIGTPADELSFMGDIISGPFDVDKLDYLVRDCHFCGIKADVDVQRVLVSVDLLSRDRFPPTKPGWSKRYLVMKSAGESILEQITFNRMLLFPAIYHHHKVRALECMIKAIFEIIWDSPEKIVDKRLKFERIRDFFSLTDFEFLTLAAEEEQLKPYINKLLERDLLKRCLVISRPYLTSKGGNFLDLYKKSSEEYPQRLRSLRETILAELPPKRRPSIYDLWVDIPKLPTSIAEDPDSAWVDIGTDRMRTLSDFFPYPEWVASYGINKWKGHVFSISDPNIRHAVNETAVKVLKEEPYLLEFDDQATRECKIPS